MPIVVVVANHPSITSSSEFEIEMGLTCSLEPACLSDFLKLYLFNVSLQSLSFFLIASKALSNLDIGEDF
jgi:hypothetical protein